MKEFVISEAKAETAVLVGLITKEQDEAKTKEYLDELEFLADTAGAVTVKRFTQKVGGPSQTTYVGSGKLLEIKEYIKQCQDAYDDWLDAQDASLFADGLLDVPSARYAGETCHRMILPMFSLMSAKQACARSFCLSFNNGMI